MARQAAPHERPAATSAPTTAPTRSRRRTRRQRLDRVDSDPLARAITYAEKHHSALKVYLGNPDVPIDTNHLERALRVIPMGRKNWLFCWTEVGARQVGIVQSLLTTCRLQGVDPYTYLVDVLQRVSLHPARDVIELTPRVWKQRFAAHPLRSDLDRVHGPRPPTVAGQGRRCHHHTFSGQPEKTNQIAGRGATTARNGSLRRYARSGWAATPWTAARRQRSI